MIRLPVIRVIANKKIALAFSKQVTDLPWTANISLPSTHNLNNYVLYIFNSTEDQLLSPDKLIHVITFCLTRIDQNFEEKIIDAGKNPVCCINTVNPEEILYGISGNFGEYAIGVPRHNLEFSRPISALHNGKTMTESIIELFDLKQ
jgi:hypothetical protein